MNASLKAPPVAIEIAKIQRDMLLQPRAEMHRDWIEDYAADMIGGAIFPPIIVFFDGEKYWLADGFHRLHAAEASGLSHIAADVRPGERRDALLLSVGVNGQHGHRRTTDDKRRAVDIMLGDTEWAKWSDRQIAEQCAVSHEMVRGRRPSICQTLTDSRLVTRNGATYEMHTSGIGGVVPPAPDNRIETEAAAEPAQFAFDWDASRIRTAAMDAIRALANQPEAQVVIDAWMKSASYGEPVDTLEKAHAWLGHFIALYRLNEPVRWARVQRTGGSLDDAQ